jgi:hypothetical protein
MVRRQSLTCDVGAQHLACDNMGMNACDFNTIVGSIVNLAVRQRLPQLDNAILGQRRVEDG